MINANRSIIYKVCNVYGCKKSYQEDLFQEIVMQLWKSFPRFRGESLPSTWIYRIALNTAVTHFRKENRQVVRQTMSPQMLEVADIPPFLNEDHQEIMLRQAIEKLSRIEKAIILLYLDDKTYEEIGEIIGITKNNAGVKLNRIKSKLEKIIKTLEYDNR